MRARCVLLATAFLAGCQSAGARGAPDAGSGMLPQRGQVQVETRDGRKLELAVEIASRPAERERGLMFRQRLADNEGMIFVFAREELQTFWMKNTPLPLDMLFIDAGGTVVGIVENAQPFTTSPRFVNKPSKMVLEVKGGWCAKNAVRPGDRVRLVGMYELVE